MNAKKIIRETGIQIGLLFTGLFLIVGGGKAFAAETTSAEEKTFTSAEDFNDPSVIIGLPQGSAAEWAVKAELPKAQIQYYNKNEDGYLSVRQGKIDAYAYDKSIMTYAVTGGLEGVMLAPDITLGSPENIAVGISRKTQVPELLDQWNHVIGTLREDGTLDDMYDRWVVKGETAMPEIQDPDQPAVTIKVGTTGLVPPYNYYQDEELTGYDIELVKRFASLINAKIEISIYDFDGLVAALQSGSIDCAVANLNATAERRKVVDFSDPVLHSETALLVKKSPDSQSGEINRVADMAGKTAITLTGSSFAGGLAKRVDGVEYVYFNNIADELMALETGKGDAVLLDEPVARLLIAQKPYYRMVEEPIADDSYGFAFKKGDPLCQDISGVIDEMWENGTIDKLAEKWFSADEASKVLTDYSKEPGYDQSAGTLVYGCNAALEPMCYVGDGIVTGFDMDALRYIAYKLNYRLDVVQMEFDALIPAVVSGRVDFAGGCMSITEERKKSVDFSSAYYTGGQVILVMDHSAKDGQKTGFLAGIKESFRKNFIVENRWKMIVEGIRTTLIITFCAAVLGTALGFLICFARRSRYRLLSGLAKIYVMILQGMPMVVLLMILFYVVFTSGAVGAVPVAVIGFGLNFAAYVSEMIRTGIEAVDKGQTEAALALGFTKSQCFLRIILPQAARHFLPVFKGEFISMLKMTSVVGYIAIQDLTKMSDLIRSRTFEAFFPLIVTAIIYFLLSYLLAFLVGLLEMKIDPKRRPRKLKGIEIER